MLKDSVVNPYLLQALELAKNYRGSCAPNPAVGAVIVKGESVIATGAHQGPGTDHAEKVALRNLSVLQSRGATLYVTLEPCCHYGQTPPCTQEIIQHQLAKVVYAYVDPHNVVNGKGVAQLEASGVHCIHHPLPQIDQFYQSYNHWIQTGLPWVTAKLAVSIDGRIADEKGLSTPITGEAAYKFTHEQRQRSDAILTTSRTIQRDDPQLNVRRLTKHQSKSIYVLDSRLETPLQARIFEQAAQVVLLHLPSTNRSHLSPYKHKVRCIPVTPDPIHPNRVSLTAVMKVIGLNGVHDLWVEAGGLCFSALLQQQLVKRAYIYVAPKTLGQSATLGFWSSREHRDLFCKAKRFDWKVLGEDALLTVDH